MYDEQKCKIKHKEIVLNMNVQEVIIINMVMFQILFSNMR